MCKNKYKHVIVVVQVQIPVHCACVKRGIFISEYSSEWQLQQGESYPLTTNQCSIEDCISTTEGVAIWTSLAKNIAHNNFRHYFNTQILTCKTDYLNSLSYNKPTIWRHTEQYKHVLTTSKQATYHKFKTGQYQQTSKPATMTKTTDEEIEHTHTHTHTHTRTEHHTDPSKFPSSVNSPLFHFATTTTTRLLFHRRWVALNFINST